MLFDQGEKSYLFFSLFSLLSYLFSGKVARESWRKVKSEKRIVKSTKRKSRLRDFSFWLREWDLLLMIIARYEFASGYLLFVGRTRRITQCLTPTFVAFGL